MIWCDTQAVQGDGLQNRYSRVRIPFAPPILISGDLCNIVFAISF